MNEVRLSGVVSVRKSFPARDGKKALVFASIKIPDGPYVDVKAFDTAAEQLGNAHELPVTVAGRIGVEKPKDDAPKGTPWRMVVVVEHVTEHAPENKQAEQEPF